MKFPFALVSDPELKVADLYGSHAAGRPVASRTVYVHRQGRQGRVARDEVQRAERGGLHALAAAVAKAR
jgi:peroxiredoxin